jgi:nitrogen regulatory protein PII
MSSEAFPLPSLVVLILHNVARFQDVLSAWHEAGVPAVTILDCVGTRDVREKLQREELPIMPSIRDLLAGDDAPRKMILSVVSGDTVEWLIKATVDAVGDLSEPGNGILFVVPVARAVGVRGL